MRRRAMLVLLIEAFRSAWSPGASGPWVVGGRRAETVASARAIKEAESRATQSLGKGSDHNRGQPRSSCPLISRCGRRPGAQSRRTNHVVCTWSCTKASAVKRHLTRPGPRIVLRAGHLPGSTVLALPAMAPELQMAKEASH
jgi:hypothetical protein